MTLFMLGIIIIIHIITVVISLRIRILRIRVHYYHNILYILNTLLITSESDCITRFQDSDTEQKQWDTWNMKFPITKWRSIIHYATTAPDIKQSCLFNLNFSHQSVGLDPQFYCHGDTVPQSFEQIRSELNFAVVQRGGSNGMKLAPFLLFWA